MNAFCFIKVFHSEFFYSDAHTHTHTMQQFRDNLFSTPRVCEHCSFRSSSWKVDTIPKYTFRLVTKCDFELKSCVNRIVLHSICSFFSHRQMLPSTSHPFSLLWTSDWTAIRIDLIFYVAGLVALVLLVSLHRWSIPTAQITEMT